MTKTIKHILKTKRITDILLNPKKSGSGLRVNYIYITNSDKYKEYKVTIKVAGVPIAKRYTIPPESTLALLDKESSILLEENKKIQAIAYKPNILSVVACYEVIKYQLKEQPNEDSR